MYSFLSNLYPEKAREEFLSLLSYFEVQVRKEFILGSIFFFVLGSSLIISFQFSRKILFMLPPVLALIIISIASFIVLHLLVYSIISMIATNRGRFIEKILPDALQLIAANLRAGMTIDRALLASNRKEFGYLNYLFIIVGKEISTGTEVSEALLNMTKRVKSEKFAKSLELIVMAMRSGGELSRLLGQVAENLVHQQNIEDKIRAGVTTYLIFIGAAVSFAAPFLYALSTVFVNIIITSFGNVDIPAEAMRNMPFTIKMTPEQVIFLPDFVKMYSMICLMTLGVMSSFLLGLIKKGKVKFGITYIPIIVGSSMLIYFVVRGGALFIFGSVI